MVRKDKDTAQRFQGGILVGNVLILFTSLFYYKFYLFPGYKIIITHSENTKVPALEGVEILNMNKEYLKKQITLAQGQVLETFSEAQILYMQSSQPRKPIQSQKDIFLRKTLPADESPTKFLCISNTYCLTAKFIQCLTVGIPIINFEWVVHSISQNKCLNWYNFLLPAGMSLITGYVMEQSFNDSFKVSAIGEVAEILKGDKVFLATSSKPGFKDMWISLLSTAAASVFDMPSKGGNIQRLLDRRTVVVIADSSIPPEEEKRALEVGVPIVSSQWFIQSLLAGCKLDFNAHKEFNYKYVKDEQPDTSGSSCNNSTVSIKPR